MPRVLRALPFLLLALGLPSLAPEAHATTPEDARRLVVQLRGDNTFGAGVVFAVEPPLVYVATANHVVRKGLREETGLTVAFETWPGERFPATLLESVNPNLDLAVLRVDLSEHKIPEALLPRPDRVAFAPGRDLERGAEVVPIGHPEGQPWYVPGKAASVYSAGGFEIGIEFSCGQGHSGGALYDGRWRLVGMLLRTNNFVCTAVSFETVVAELRKWRYPVEPVELAPKAGQLPQTRGLAVVVLDAEGRLDERAAQDLVARLAEEGFRAKIGSARTSPGDREHRLVATLEAVTFQDNPDLEGMKTARLRFTVSLSTADDVQLPMAPGSVAGAGFSEAVAEEAARRRAFQAIVDQVAERLR